MNERKKEKGERIGRYVTLEIAFRWHRGTWVITDDCREAAVVSFALHPLCSTLASPRFAGYQPGTPVNLSRGFRIVVVVWMADEKQ